MRLLAKQRQLVPSAPYTNASPWGPREGHEQTRGTVPALQGHLPGWVLRKASTVMWLFQRGVKVSVGGCVLTLVTGAGKLPGGGWNVSGGPLGSCTSHVGTMASCQEVGTQPATGSRWPLVTMGFLCARAKHRICFVHIGMCCNLCPAAPTHTEARVSPYLCCIGEGVPSWASTRPRCPEMAAAGSALGP